MDREQKLQQLMKESRKIFLNEQREKLDAALVNLLDYRLHRRDSELKELERFFHSLKGSGSTLQLDEILALGTEYNDYIKKIEEGKEPSDRIFLKLLDGVAFAHESLEKLAHEINASGQNKEDIEQQLKEEIQGGDITSADVNNSEDDLSQRKRILIIDDVSAIVYLIQGQLESMDYEIRAAVWCR